MLLSQLLKIGTRLEKHGVFDPVLEKDSHFYINIQRLKQTDVPEFVNSYETIQSFFRKLIKLLDKAQKPLETDTFYRAAVKTFHFPEVNGIRLGHSKGNNGAGFGKVLEEQTIRTAYDIVKAGIEDPEFFEMIPLFQRKVAADRLSDMIARLVLDDIYLYTKRIYKEFNINRKKYPELDFDQEGFIVRNNHPVLLVPVQIIHKLPVAERWSDISIVMSENNAIKTEINAFVAAQWEKYNSDERKEAIKREIFLDPDSFAHILAEYKQEELDQVNIHSDFEYLLAKLRQIAALCPDEWSVKTKELESFPATIDFIDRFKHWVEYNGGWDVIKDLPSINKEKKIQRIIHGFADYYVEKNNLSISCEPNEGYGPCDFKISRGQDCTVVELKLTTNKQYRHGFVKQLPLYAKAEKTDNMVYVLMDVDHSGHVNILQALHDRMVDEGTITPELIIIDANEKPSASKA